MSKRQRRRDQSRQATHMRQARHKLPVALAAVAAPAVVPAAAQAAHQSVISLSASSAHLMSHALAGHSSLEGHHLVARGRAALAREDVMARAERSFQRERTLPASALQIAHRLGRGGLRSARPSALPNWARGFPYGSRLRVAATPILESDSSGMSGAGAAVAPSPSGPQEAAATSPAPQQQGPGVRVSDNPDAPLSVPNPAPPQPSDRGIAASLSYYQGLGGGATLLSYQGQTYLIPEVGVGFGPAASFTQGQEVTTPPGAAVQGSVQGPNGSLSATIPTANPNDASIQVTVDRQLSPVESETAPPGADTGIGKVVTVSRHGVATGDELSSGEQEKVDLQVAIPLPNVQHVSVPNAEGVAMVTSLMDSSAPPVITAVRTVEGLPNSYDVGDGTTATSNPDGSVTIHNATGDVTVYGNQYLAQNGLDPSNAGTMTHTLIDSNEQPVDVVSWHPADGSAPVTTKDTSSGTLTQSNPDQTTVQQNAAGVRTFTGADGSSVAWDPSTNVLTTKSDGVTTDFLPDGSVQQSGGDFPTRWDSSGNRYVTDWYSGQEFSMGNSEPPPARPDTPPEVPDLQAGPPIAPPDAWNWQTSTPDLGPQGDAPAPAPAPTPTAGPDSPPAPDGTDASASAPTDTSPAATDASPAAPDAAPTPWVETTPTVEATPTPPAAPAEPPPTDPTPQTTPWPTSTPTPGPTPSPDPTAATTPTPDSAPVPTADATPTPAATDTPAPADNSAPADTTTPTPSPSDAGSSDPSAGDPTAGDPGTADPGSSDPASSDPGSSGDGGGD